MRQISNIETAQSCCYKKDASCKLHPAIWQTCLARFQL